MSAGATAALPVAVIGADTVGFGRWNAEHGFAAGDRLLVTVADRLVSAPVGPGLWGRVGPDRFCWVGRVADADEATRWGGWSPRTRPTPRPASRRAAAS